MGWVCGQHDHGSGRIIIPLHKTHQPPDSRFFLSHETRNSREYLQLADLYCVRLECCRVIYWHRSPRWHIDTWVWHIGLADIAICLALGQRQKWTVLVVKRNRTPTVKLWMQFFVSNRSSLSGVIHSPNKKLLPNSTVLSFSTVNS